MPKAMIPVGSAKVEVLGSYGPATWANVFYAVPTTVDPAHLQDVVALLTGCMEDYYATAWGLGTFPNDWHFEKVRVVFRDSSSSVYRATLVAAYAGTGGAGEAAQVSYLVDWQTGDPRKGGKPRTYIPGVLTGLMTDSVHVSSTAMAGVASRTVTWITANLTRSSGTATGAVFGEMSFRNANAWRTTPLFYPFIAGPPSLEVATQRRRVDRLRS